MPTPIAQNGCRILGLGSPHGDDQVGWHVVDCLPQDAAFYGQTFRLQSAWQVLDHLPVCSRMIVIDACRSNSPAGTIRRLSAAEVVNSGLSFASTHEESLAEVFRLAQAIGRDLSRIIVYAVEVTTCEVGTPLSEAAQRAAEQLVRLIAQDSSHDRRMPQG